MHQKIKTHTVKEMLQFIADQIDSKCKEKEEEKKTVGAITELGERGSKFPEQGGIGSSRNQVRQSPNPRIPPTPMEIFNQMAGEQVSR